MPELYICRTTYEFFPNILLIINFVLKLSISLHFYLTFSYQIFRHITCLHNSLLDFVIDY